MSLSDYISIFDTRPIAQSHLSGAATATFCQHTTQRDIHGAQRVASLGYTYERVRERARQSCNTNTNTVLRTLCTARLGTERNGAVQPRHAMPRHATLRYATPRYGKRRFVGPISRRLGPLWLSFSLYLSLCLSWFSRR